METKDWSLMGALKQSWSLTKENLIVVWGLLFLIGVVAVVLDLLGGAEYSARFWIFWVIQLLVAGWLNGGMYKALLNMHDEGEASFSVFKELIPYIGKLFALSILSSMIIYAPIIIVAFIQSLFVAVDWTLFSMTDITAMSTFYATLFAGFWAWVWMVALLAMFYLALRLLFTVYAFVDHPGEGIIAALRRSWQMTQGKVGKLILAFVVILAINLVGLCALVIGVFVSIVTSVFLLTVLYRQIDREMNAPKITTDETVLCDKL